MKEKTGFSVSGGAVLLLAALWFFAGSNTFFSLLLAVLFHELGHLAALGLFGCRAGGFRAEMSGVEISGAWCLSPFQEVCCAAAGPISGILFAFAAAKLGGALQSGLLLRSAGISVVLSVFNLLPALPLDGGRIQSVLQRGGRGATALSFVTALLTLGFGLLLLARGVGAGLLIAGIWLMLLQADL